MRANRTSEPEAVDFPVIDPVWIRPDGSRFFHRINEDVNPFMKSIFPRIAFVLAPGKNRSYVHLCRVILFKEV
jgi:hypothetical protein